MKPFLLAIPLFMACAGPASQQVVKDHQGRVRALVSRVNGDKEGPVRFFDSAGNLETTGEYAGDSRHGSWISVDAKGDTLAIVNFNHGRKEGFQAYWAPNRQLLRFERFDRGMPDGPLYRFFSDGMPRQVTWYDHDIPSGTYMEWYKSDSTGVALTMGGFTKGERSGTWTWLYGNRRVKTQGAYHQGKKIGPWRNWDAKGHLMETLDLGAP